MNRYDMVSFVWLLSSFNFPWKVRTLGRDQAYYFYGRGTWWLSTAEEGQVEVTRFVGLVFCFVAFYQECLLREEKRMVNWY